MEYYSAIRKNEITSYAATWMDSEITLLSKRKTYYMIFKKWHKGTRIQKRKRLTDLWIHWEWMYGYQWGRVMGKDRLGFGVDVYALCVSVKSLSRVQLCDPVDCSPPGSSVHGILQAWTLEWVAMPSSRGSSQPRDRTSISGISCIGR